MTFSMRTEKLDDEVSLYTVSNGEISFSAMDYGCTITNLFVPAKTGEKIDILLGFDSFDEWKAGTASHNAIVGRVANRIRGATFTLDGKSYSLDKNDGENCLHGGFTRYEKMLWIAEEISNADGEGVRFTRKSADGEQGFPGNLEISVSYTLTAQSELIFEYKATTDAATPLNLTNHAYFNLDGGGTVLNHDLQLDSERFLESAGDNAPSGKILFVADNPAFDFRTEKSVGKDIEKFRSGKKIFGYDHCFVTRAEDEKKLVRFGKIRSEKSGISMEIFTNQRGCHMYTGNYLAGTGKGGAEQKMHSGICFETERFPNAVNEPSFPSCILRPGEQYWHKTVLKLKTEE